mmetsp:Transcript_31279/g.57264  ORF Transcript_31279/g.57264 Transcript_31279/m.57264 type:complete len:81 (+) Transcript_31279:49-291(+)
MWSAMRLRHNGTGKLQAMHPQKAACELRQREAPLNVLNKAALHFGNATAVLSRSSQSQECMEYMASAQSPSVVVVPTSSK